jgi:hypothetical protein
MRRYLRSRTHAALAPAGVLFTLIAAAIWPVPGWASDSPTSGQPSPSTTTSSRSDDIVQIHNWSLTGGVTDAALGQPIPLPSGATINGAADLTTGKLRGDIYVPSYTTTLSLFGFLPVQVGVTFSETGPATGTITTDPVTPGDLDVNAISKDNIAITSAGLFGINLPLDCATSRPVKFRLVATLPASWLTNGGTFTGQTTYPSITCGGLLGAFEGPLLSLLFTGPNNTYSLTLTPPSPSGNSG